MNNDFYTHSTDWLRAVTQTESLWRFRCGVRLLRLHRKYYKTDPRIIERAGKDSGLGRTSAYDYLAIARFLLQWRGIAARRFFEDFPALSHTHLRYSLSLTYEDRIDALIHAANLLMTPEEFLLYLHGQRGKPGKPIFEQSGYLSEVMQSLAAARETLGDRRVQVTIREIKDTKG